jgi:predicted MPP superfamily phosphohydrolase
MAMFGTVLISIVTVMHLYVFWRSASVPFIARRFHAVPVAAAGTLLWALFLAGRVYGHHGTGHFAAAIEFAGMNWMAALFLFFLCLLSVDAATAFGLLLRRRAPALRGWALVAGGVLTVIALWQGMRPPVVREYEVRLPGLPGGLDGTTIAAMSDLHLGSQAGVGWLSKRVTQVQELRPDMVVLLGDIFEGHGRPEPELLSLLGRLSAPLGVWAVPGNHERYGGDGVNGMVEEAGIGLLRSRSVEIRPGFVLAGVDDLTSRRRPAKRDDSMDAALSNRPPGVTVLLSHTPLKYDEASRAGVGLMLSGHTHGGQIWPFGYLVRRRYPLFAGRYAVGGMTVIVSRGAGTWGPRMRLWHPGEILRVTLRGS